MRKWLIPILCLLVGGIIYLLSRTNILFMDWLGMTGRKVNAAGHPLLYAIVYCLPDGLWYYALLHAEYTLTQNNTPLSKFCFILAIVFPFVLECLQKNNIVIGTFDWWDIVIYLFTLILFLLCKRKHL